MIATTKITRSHLDRVALVYVRQSTPAQVRDNTESTARQYALADEAARLGWDAANIEIIDGDLGMSGRASATREGFKELVTRVCMGEVGVVLGLEVSRFSRSSADLQRLLEFCSLTDTLLMDADGIYDLQDFNDRLLLGLKGTMSEAELHILSGRLRESQRAAARRGDLRFALPVGYVHDDDGHTVMDPDEEIRSAVADVFAEFERTGSAYAVVGAFASRPFPRRMNGGAWAGEVRRVRLTHGGVLRLLKNPAYAGAYAYGRCRVRRTVAPDGTIKVKARRLPRADWPVVINDHHAGYITWDQYLANQARLDANNARQGGRPPRCGTALLQGIVFCGSCGRPMSTTYGSASAVYDCLRSRSDHVNTPGCRSVGVVNIDSVVAARLLAVVAPHEIALALAATHEVGQRRAKKIGVLELAVERARYEATRAERAFHHCEPENRLVARSLEHRWEAKLAALADAEGGLIEARNTLRPLPRREELESLARDLPRLWAAPTTSPRDRKRLLRTLIADVTLTSAAESGTIRVGIRWRAGAAEEFTVPRPALLYQHRRTSDAAVDVVRQLAGSPDADIVAALHAAGLKTGADRPFDVRAVRWLRYSHRVAPSHLDAAAPGETTVTTVAASCGVTDNVVYYWLYRGFLRGRHTRSGRWHIPFTPEVQQRCRDLARGSSSGSRSRPVPP